MRNDVMGFALVYVGVDIQFPTTVTPPKIKKTQVPIILQHYLLPLFTPNILQQKWITRQQQ